MAKAPKVKLPVSSITGRATTQTAKSLAAVKLDLEKKIRKLMAAKKLTAKQKKELAGYRAQLKDVKAELSSEASAAGRSMQQSARDRKMKDKVTMPESLDSVMKRKAKEKADAEFAAEEERLAGAGPSNYKPTRKAKGGVMGFNMGGMPSRKGSFDYRKGGLFK